MVPTIVVQTVGLADWVGLPNPHSCRYCGTNRGANPSSCRYRGVNPADKIPYRGVNPADKIPPRVVIVVSTPGFGTLLVSIPGAAASSSRYRGVNPADKIPYRPWCNQTPVAIVVQTRGSTSSSCR